ncbi:MAG TPA: hypothetical protein VF139_08990 [Candidatus Polarisedimenticolaceae bacterium]
MKRTTLGIILGATLACAAAYGLELAFEWTWTQVLLVVILEVILLAAAVLARPERDLPLLCDPIVLFVAFQVQFFVVGPLALPYTTFYATVPMSPERIAGTVGWFVALMAMFWLGYQAPVASVLAGVLPDFAGTRRRVSGRLVESVLLIGMLGGCVGFIYYQGGLGDMVNRGYGQGKAGAMFTAVFLLLVLATVLMAWRVFSAPTARRRDWILLGAVILFEVGYWGILLGQRKWLFYLFFGLSAIFLLRRGTRAIPRWLLPLVLVLLVIYLSVWGSVRGRPLAALVSENADPRYAQIESLHSGYIEGVAGPFGGACLVFEVFPEVEPYRYGQTLLVALLSPIPRAIWPDKPVGLGKELTRYMGGYYGIFYDPTAGLSITPTLVGDFHANLGSIGVLLGGLALGLSCRTVAAYAVRNMRDGLQLTPARALIPAIFLAGMVEVRADLTMMVLFYMYTLLPLIVLLMFCSFEYGETAAPAPGSIAQGTSAAGGSRNTPARISPSAASVP